MKTTLDLVFQDFNPLHAVTHENGTQELIWKEVIKTTSYMQWMHSLDSFKDIDMKLSQNCQEYSFQVIDRYAWSLIFSTNK